MRLTRMPFLGTVLCVGVVVVGQTNVVESAVGAMSSEVSGQVTPTDAVIVRPAAEGPFFHAAKREQDATWSLRVCSGGLAASQSERTLDQLWLTAMHAVLPSESRRPSRHDSCRTCRPRHSTSGWSSR